MSTPTTAGKLALDAVYGDPAPALAEFGALHPDLLLDLDLSDRVVDLVEEGFDLAIRIAELTEARRILLGAR